MQWNVGFYVLSVHSPHDSVLSQRFGQGINHNQSRFSGPSDKYLLVACAKC